MKKFFNWYFKKRPPEQVKYYKKTNKERAKVVHGEDGSLQMMVEGEKYPFPGFPRGHVLFGSLASLKKTMKQAVFNELAAVVPDMLPVEQMCPFVRELYRVMTDLENAEITPDMKSEMYNMKKILCFFFQEDDAYRFRVQWLLEHLDMKKVKLSKADKYFFRAKWFKVEHDKYDY